MFSSQKSNSQSFPGTYETGSLAFQPLNLFLILTPLHEAADLHVQARVDGLLPLQALFYLNVVLFKVARQLALLNQIVVHLGHLDSAHLQPAVNQKTKKSVCQGPRLNRNIPLSRCSPAARSCSCEQTRPPSPVAKTGTNWPLGCWGCWWAPPPLWTCSACRLWTSRSGCCGGWSAVWQSFYLFCCFW